MFAGAHLHRSSGPKSGIPFSSLKHMVGMEMTSLYAGTPRRVLVDCETRGLLTVCLLAVTYHLDLTLPHVHGRTQPANLALAVPM